MSAIIMNDVMEDVIDVVRSNVEGLTPDEVSALQMGTVTFDSGETDLRLFDSGESAAQINQMLAGYTLLGTCSKCGGPVISPVVYAGENAPVWCTCCHAVPVATVVGFFGPVLDMV